MNGFVNINNYAFKHSVSIYIYIYIYIYLFKVQILNKYIIYINKV